MQIIIKITTTRCKDVFSIIVEGKLNRVTANEAMKPINLNSDTTNLILDTAFSGAKLEPMTRKKKMLMLVA